MANGDSFFQSIREDDFVEYYLFPLIESSDETNQEKILNSILERANNIANHTTNFIWHKDAFKLCSRPSVFNGVENVLPPHLYGISHYGDNIEDEWFMVYIIIELTKEINGLVGRIYDVDGEFLLIEAADYLPSWATPENCENRVYIYDGNIHLIPPDFEKNSQNSFIHALCQIREKTLQTQASLKIQNSIRSKLDGYPQKIKDNFHRANIFVPVSIAVILKYKPHLIAPAVQAFCNRDNIDVNACRAMKYFPPESRVMVQVTFTKCLYAMITHSKYLPDKRTGWNLPSVNSKEYKSNLLGVKVACGFEILASQAKTFVDVHSDKGWHSFLKTLKDKEYFKGLLENSNEFNNLLKRAKEYYISHRATTHFCPAIGQEILELLKSLELNSEEFERESENQDDDDDSWLNIEPEELNKMLGEKYGLKKIFNVNNNTDSSIFTQKISNFLRHESDYEGAEFQEQNVTPVRLSIQKNKNKVSFSEDTAENLKSSKNRVNFDPSSFACAVQNILNFVVPEDDSWNFESDSDMSEYEEDGCVTEENYKIDKVKMEKYMKEMDRELAKTTIGESFEKKSGETFHDIEDFQPVDIEVNALKNILESYRFQMGEAGPSSNMLGPMGIYLDTKNKIDHK